MDGSPARPFAEGATNASEGLLKFLESVNGK